MWARAALAAILIGTISELMVTHAFGGNSLTYNTDSALAEHPRGIQPMIVITVTKAGEPPVPEAIQIANFSPNVEMSASLAEERVPIVAQIKILGSSHVGARRERNVSEESVLIDWEIGPTPVKVNFNTERPAHFAGGQVANVTNHGVSYTVSREGIDPASLHRNIGALENFSVATLVAYSDKSYDPQPDSGNGERERKEGNRIARRSLPEGFALFTFVTAVLGGFITFLLLGLSGCIRRLPSESSRPEDRCQQESKNDTGRARYYGANATSPKSRNFIAQWLKEQREAP